MRFKTIITILFALTAMAVKAQNTVTVCFQLASKAKGEMATLIYPDFFTGSTTALHPVTDSEGRWTVTIPAYRTLHIQIWDSNKIQGVIWGALNLFCRPGTKAEILLDDINDRCIFSGENAEMHNIQITHPLKMEYFHGKMFNMDMQEAAGYIRNIYKDNCHRIDTLSKAHPELSKAYVESLRQLTRYGYAMDMTQNVLGHFFDSMTKIMAKRNDMPEEYLDLLREVETEVLLYPQSPLPCDAVTYFCDIVRLEEIARKGIIRELPDDIKDPQLYAFSQKCDVINSLNASNDVKQLMKVYCSVQHFRQEITPEREAFLRNQLTTESLNMLRHYSENKQKQFANISEKEVETLEEAPIDSLVDGKDIFQKLIAPYRGRVVYIDVWGTWCGPCRAEMEFVPQLHEALKDLPVTYMYLANKSPEELWKKSAKKYGLEGADCVNLRLPDAQQSAVEDYLGLKGYPTFLLVAPDGTIVTNEAPRPSASYDVRKAIQKIIE